MSRSVTKTEWFIGLMIGVLMALVVGLLLSTLFGPSLPRIDLD